MNITLNGKSVRTEASHILQVISEFNLPEKGIAVALNNKVIPSVKWSVTPINEGDSIVVITAAYGG